MEVKVGLIGCGNMGSGLAKACSQLENATVVGVGTLIAGQCSSMGGYDGKIHCRKGTIHFDNGKSLVHV